MDLKHLFCYNLDMVNHMKSVNYIKINTQNILDNLSYIRNNYPYPNYILKVSNHAFSHGMYLIKMLAESITYLYVNHFDDLLMIRKYNQDIPVIYDGEIHEDNVYDLMMNNAIVVIHDFAVLQNIRNLNIKDNLSFIFYVDPPGYVGICNKQDILDFLEWDSKHLECLGVMAHLNEKNYDDFKYIIRPIANSKLMILNFEEDKRKIQGSNTLLLDQSIYGINQIKKKLFQKSDTPLKQAFCLYSKVICVKEEVHNKKSKYIAVIPFGYHHGMNEAIKNVYIRDQLYPVIEIFDEFTYVLVDERINKDIEVEITSENNPLENYFSNQTLNYFSLFNSNIPIIYDDYILEKMLIY